MRHFTDPDYRRSPLTTIFCCICSRDLKTVAATVYLGDDPADIVDNTEPDYNPEWIGNIGSECVKKVPKELLI